MTAQSKATYIIGYSTYVVLVWSILVDQPTITMEFVSFFPGPLFAVLILLFTPKVTINKGVAFFMTCCVIYYLTLYLIVNQAPDQNYFQFLILLFSTLSAILVSLSYSLLFRDRLEFRRDLLRPAIIGVQVAALTFAASFLNQFSYSPLDQIIAVFFYSIFPFWTVSMAKHLLHQH